MNILCFGNNLPLIFFNALLNLGWLLKEQLRVDYVRQHNAPTAKNSAALTVLCHVHRIIPFRTSRSFPVLDGVHSVPPGLSRYAPMVEIFSPIVDAAFAIPGSEHRQSASYIVPACATVFFALIILVLGKEAPTLPDFLLTSMMCTNACRPPP